MKARPQNELTEQEREAAIKAFEGLGLCTQLAEAAAGLGWKQPTVIQQQAVPPLIQGGHCSHRGRRDSFDCKVQLQLHVVTGQRAHERQQRQQSLDGV